MNKKNSFKLYFVLALISIGKVYASIYSCPKTPISFKIGEISYNNWNAIIRPNDNSKLYEWYLWLKGNKYSVNEWHGFSYGVNSSSENSYNILCCSSPEENKKIVLCLKRDINANKCETDFVKDKPTQFLCDEDLDKYKAELAERRRKERNRPLKPGEIRINVKKQFTSSSWN